MALKQSRLSRSFETSRLSGSFEWMESDEVFAGHVGDNNWCADCGDVPAEWASRVFGVTLCLACSGAHRSVGPLSRVASLALDRWSPEERSDFVRHGGNEAANRTVLLTTPRFSLNRDSPGPVRVAYVQAKWLGKEFHLHQALEEARRSISQITVNQGILKIQLIHGRQLKAADLSGKSDPYVVFGIGKFKEKELKSSHLAQSSIAKQTLNPDWNETFMLNVPSLSEGLTCQVWVRKTTKKKKEI